MKGLLKYIVLVLAIAVYSCVGVFTRMAADYPFLSLPYILLLGGAVAVIGLYAVMWQQLIQRIALSTAYMFRGLGVVFGLLICHFVFGEVITVNNIIGAVIIIGGITCFTME